MKNYKIILLACDGDSTRIAFHKIIEKFDIDKVVLEKKVSTKKIIQRKIKKHGYINTFGQILFQLLVPNILRLTTKKRISEIYNTYELKDAAIPENKIIRISSVNEVSTINLLKELKPDLIVVNGTRIISNKIISGVNCPLINIHAGITPKYRGVHGGYWSVWNKDNSNFGVTVHFIDAGVDTGKIISQKNISINPNDNFITYPLVQHANGLHLLLKAIEDHLSNKISYSVGPTLESLQWYHPTLWGYLWARIVRGIK